MWKWIKNLNPFAAELKNTKGLPTAVKNLEPVLLDVDRDTMGRLVRYAWVEWAKTQPAPKASWLVPYSELSEADKEADRQIGEYLWRKALEHQRIATPHDTTSDEVEALARVLCEGVTCQVCSGHTSDEDRGCCCDRALARAALEGE